jgi:hypothetical protein
MKSLLSAGKIVSYLLDCICLFDIVDGVKTIGDFVSKVESLAETNFPNAQCDEKELDKLNSFKGDMLEILTEIFFYVYSADPAVGIRDYVPVALSEDYGVDGIGTNVNGDRCAIQVKYRKNPIELITYGDIAKTDSAGRRRHNLPLEKNNTIFLFTTGEGITSACEQVFGNVIRVINRRIISGMIDNNNNFWESANDLILLTLDNLKQDK